MILKSHHWFKSYVNFADLVVFAYWWSCIRINRATPSIFLAFSATIFCLNHRNKTKLVVVVVEAHYNYFFTFFRGWGSCGLWASSLRQSQFLLLN